MTEEAFFEMFPPDLIVRIKNKEPEAVSEAFFNNYDIFKKSAIKQRIKDNYVLELDCYLNDIYISIPHMNYSCPGLYFTDLKRVLSTVKFGGYFYLFENNKKMLYSTYNSIGSVQSLYFELEGKVKSVVDFVGTPCPSVEDVYFNNLQNIKSIDLKKLLNVLYSLLTPIQRKVFKLYIDGYSYVEIGRKLSKSHQWARAIMEKARKTFAIHYEKIKDSLKLLIGDDYKKFDLIISERMLKILDEREKASIRYHEKRKCKVTT